MYLYCVVPKRTCQPHLICRNIARLFDLGYLAVLRPRKTERGVTVKVTGIQSPVMKSRLTVFISILSLTCLCACQKIDFGGIMGSKNKTPASIPGVAPVNEMKPHSVSSQTNDAPLSGHWKMAYSVNGDVKSSHVHLTQTGETFSGEGTDDQSNKAFVIEKGTIQNGDLIGFIKRYQDNPNSLPVEYGGNLDKTSNAYVNGRYLASVNGQSFEGEWEAEKEKSDPPPTSGSNSSSSSGASHASHKPGHAPDLSGKWNTGYEYQFKTINSTMWLMQENNKLKGHGIDHSTKENFVIEEGWYAFPKVTLIRKYSAIRSKKVNKPERKMTFKAT